MHVGLVVECSEGGVTLKLFPCCPSKVLEAVVIVVVEMHVG